MDWNKLDSKELFEGETSERSVVMILAPKQSTKNVWGLYRIKEGIKLGDFQQHGVVETSLYGRHSNGQYYLVIQFEDAASASNLIRKGSLDMYSLHFIVKSFHSNDELIETIRKFDLTQPSYHVPAPPEIAEQNILNVLNDDCLYEIFRKIDGLSDIVAINNVCSRFKEVAAKAFIPVLKRKIVEFSCLNPHGSVTLTDIETFLRRFGSYINSVFLDEAKFRHLQDWDVINPILKLMHKYCTNLKCLTLYKYPKMEEVKNETLIEIRPLLSKLSSLVIFDGSRSKYCDFISACTEIKSLTADVNSWDRGSVLPEIKFPKLKCLKTFPQIALHGFLANNTQIEELDCLHSSESVQLVSEILPNIRKLTLNCSNSIITDPDSIHLRSLKQAKISLQMMLLDDPIENLFEIKNITSLRLLVSYNFDNDNLLVEVTKHLWNLEKLHLDYLLWNKPILLKELLKEMLQHANKMTKLTISSRAIHSEIYACHFHEDYNEILQVVRGRINPLKLNIDCFTTLYRRISDGDNAEHKIKTISLNTHSQWLTITARYENKPFTSAPDSSKNNLSIRSQSVSELLNLGYFDAWFNQRVLLRMLTNFVYECGCFII